MNNSITIEYNGVKFTGSMEEVMALMAKIQTPILSQPSRESIVVMPDEVRTSKVKPNAHEFCTIGDDKPYIVGGSKVYPKHKLVRHWEGEFRTEKGRFAIKNTLKEAGAVWNKNWEAYEFKTKKDFEAWVKAQKEYEANKAKK